MSPFRLYPDARPSTLHRYRAAAPSLRHLRWGRGAGGSHGPAYAQELVRLGAPEELVVRLRAFLRARHPEQPGLYHGLAHTEEVASLAARVLRGRADLTDGEKGLIVVAAALHDVDPERAPGTPARVEATLAHLDRDAEARLLLDGFGRVFRFAPAQALALIRATDYSASPREQEAKDRAAALAARGAFPGEPRAEQWGRLLAYVDRAASYVGTPEEAERRVAGLARELRAARPRRAPAPTEEQVRAGTPRFLDALRGDPLFWVLPADARARFEEVRAAFAPAPSAA